MKRRQPTIFIFSLLFVLHSFSYAQEFDGYALYNNLNSNTTFLIDADGDIAHSWSLARPCNYAVLLMESGNIMRGAVNNNNQINGAAVGGMVQEIDPSGNVVWEFIYSSGQYVSHHDITLMPNGNVLLIAWEVMSNAELSALGYQGTGQKYPTHLIEVSQNGTGGEIVWEWHIIDHVIQDVDPNLPNYGVVSEHPELMDINVPTGGGGPGPGGGGDWFHVNGVHYNAVRDQIVFSSRFLNEILIIDHSTTTEEAAGHTGGNSGKGGDFLYRWGNPSNYNLGGQFIPGAVHDARFITDDGRPRGGFIQFFNNEGNGNYSTVDAILPPLSADGYNYDRTPGEPFGPTELNWRHICEDYAWGQSASNSLPNGNVFVNMSGEYMYEADADGNVIWQYNAGPAKAFRYTCDHPGIQTLISQEVITNEFCTTSVSTTNLAEKSITVSPNPSNGIYNITGSGSANIQKIVVTDLVGRSILVQENNASFDLTAFSSGIYFLTVELDSEERITEKISLVK